MDVGAEKNEDGDDVPIESECPVLLFDEMGVVFRAFNMAEKKQLPHTVGGFDQPHKLMFFVDLVGSVANKG